MFISLVHLNFITMETESNTFTASNARITLKCE
jgi:hypothetical protein